MYTFFAGGGGGGEKCAARKQCWDEALLKICSPVFQYTNVDVNVMLCFQI